MSGARDRRSIGMLAALVVVVGMLGLTTPSSAAETESCSYGDTHAMFQGFYPFFLHQPSQLRVPLAFEGEEILIPPCQYRIWLDRDHFTFSEDDWFFGGNALAIDYEAEGITRNEAIAILNRVGHRLWLAQIDSRGRRIGPLVEQPLELTGFRDVSDSGGAVVYQQVGLILQLPPGNYVSVYEETFDGRRDFRAEVILHIVPSG